MTTEPQDEIPAAIRAAYRRGYRDGLMRVLADLRKANTAALEQLARAAEDDGEDSRVYRAR